MLGVVNLVFITLFWILSLFKAVWKAILWVFVFIIYLVNLCLDYLSAKIDRLRARCCGEKCKRVPKSNFKKSRSYLRNMETSSRVTLVLDLDNTLIQSTTVEPSTSDNDYFCTQCDGIGKLYVYRRPHLNFFLEEVSHFCDIYIYTASV